MMRTSGSSRGPGGGSHAGDAPVATETVPSDAADPVAARPDAADSPRRRGPRPDGRAGAAEPAGTAAGLASLRSPRAHPRRPAGRRRLHRPVPGLRRRLRLDGAARGHPAPHRRRLLLQLTDSATSLRGWAPSDVLRVVAALRHATEITAW